MNVITTIERIARRRGDSLALRCADATYSYRELIDTASRFAGFLERHGIRAGDRVAFYMHNDPSFIPALLGVWKAGAVAVPLNYLFPPAALRHAAIDSGARLIITPAEDLDRLRAALAGTALEHEIVTATPAAGALVSFDEAISGDPLPTTVPRLDGDDALLMYTSGSTGTPKGVRQTHRNTSAQSEAVIDQWAITEDDSALVCTPLFHVGGLQLITLPVLLAGGTVTLRRWNVDAYLADARRLHPTVIAIVPAMLIDIVNRLGDEAAPSLHSVRVCMVGGSAMPEARLKKFTDLTGVTPVNIYGQTEQSGLAIAEDLDEERRYGSLGRPLEQVVQWQIVPVGTTEPLPRGSGEVGELWVRGDAVTPGYWQLPEANRKKFSDGWFRTTDLVREAADGFIYYVERADDMIISGGENVYPQMVEGHLQACPLIAEVAIIGTHHERFTEQVTAIVVPARPDVTSDDIAAYCETQPDLRGLQRPRRIEIVEAIPRTATNKVDRPLLRSKFR